MEHFEISRGLLIPTMVGGYGYFLESPIVKQRIVLVCNLVINESYYIIHTMF